MLSLSTILNKATKINAAVRKEVSSQTYEEDPETERITPTGREQMKAVKARAYQRQLQILRDDIDTTIDLLDVIKIKEEEHDIDLLYIPTKITTTYFITIRPDETKIMFTKFLSEIFKLLNRKCFIDYHMSFEQKGIDPPDWGQGFHCHILAKMKQRGKAEVIRDVYSSVKGFTAQNCVDVKVCKNPEQVLQSYLIDYIANDEHKSATKEADAGWRARGGLKHIYRPDDVNHLPIDT